MTFNKSQWKFKKKFNERYLKKVRTTDVERFYFSVKPKHARAVNKMRIIKYDHCPFGASKKRTWGWLFFRISIWKQCEHEFKQNKFQSYISIFSAVIFYPILFDRKNIIYSANNDLQTRGSFNMCHLSFYVLHFHIKGHAKTVQFQLFSAHLIRLDQIKQFSG